MSGSMSRRGTGRRFGEAGLIRGVCASLAERADLPAWVLRAAFLAFGVLHWFMAIVLYVVLAKVLCCGTRRSLRPSSAFPPPASPPLSGVGDRFGALDARLAGLEAATLQQEASLRRQFRDLEHG